MGLKKLNFADTERKVKISSAVDVNNAALTRLEAQTGTNVDDAL